MADYRSDNMVGDLYRILYTGKVGFTLNNLPDLTLTNHQIVKSKNQQITCLLISCSIPLFKKTNK